MPFTHANTSDYNAPQMQEAASCGQKQCVFCGKSFVPFSGNVKKGMGIYCSMGCRSQHRHLKSIIAKKCAECGDIYLTKKIGNSQYCSRECSMKTLYVRRHRMRSYRHNPIHDLTTEEKKRRMAQRGYSYRQSLHGKAIHRESENLNKMFGTYTVPQSIRKNNAIRFIGSRISGGRPVRAISPIAIKETIHRVMKGETYAAYE